MNALRRAALTLHALSEHDRQWMLQRLAVPQQEALRQHLAELAELGIPRDQGLIDEALARPTGSTDWRERLAGVAAGELEALLRHEPAGAVARILAAGPWPWHQALLASLPPERAEAIEQARALTVDAGSELGEWLAQRLDQRCTQAGIALAAPGRLPLLGARALKPGVSL